MAINLTTASGTSTPSVVSPGREYVASVSGTWSSATVAVQWLGPDGTTWVPFEDSSFVDIGLTKDGGFLFVPPSELKGGQKLVVVDPRESRRHLQPNALPVHRFEVDPRPPNRVTRRKHGEAGGARHQLLAFGVLQP